MSPNVDAIVRGCLLRRKSFAATSERACSQLARHVVRAMLGCGVRVFCVIHFHDLASGFYAAGALPRHRSGTRCVLPLRHMFMHLPEACCC
jgi:hypothetical protein